MPFYARSSELGVIHQDRLPDSIAVLEAPDNFMAIGIAHSSGWDDTGLSLWHLTVHGQEVPGEWAIVDREFQPAHEHGPQPRG